ncbi:hypothetical protein ScPMuIL_015519 [Solemya velum]
MVSSFHFPIHVLPVVILQIVVTEGSEIWKGKECYVISDPHMKNFDGTLFDFHVEGFFILFKSFTGELEVQVKTHSCLENGGRPYCVCGVAVRAGRDVFLVDFCDSRPVIEVVSCEDNVLSIREVPSDNSYKIFLPTGTMVNVYKFIWSSTTTFLDVKIFPSSKDVNATGGLCGTLNGDTDDDFCTGDGVCDIVTDASDEPQNFINSARVGTSDSLFNMDSLEAKISDLLPWASGNASICSCPFATQEEGTAKYEEYDYLDANEFNCSEKSYNECDLDKLNTLKPTNFKCTITTSSERRRREILRRKKRSLLQRKRRAVETPPSTASSNESQYWTTENATAFCENYLHKSPLYSLCTTSVNVNPGDAISSCVQDITLTGTTDWSKASLESFLRTCITKVELTNIVTVETATTVTESTSGQIGDADAIYQLFCPYDCHNHGTCVNGSCVCDEGYGNGDCTIDVTEPPLTDDIFNDGLCDTHDTDCSEVSLHGANYIDSQNLTCRISIFERTSSGYQVNRSTTEIPGEYISPYEVSCHLPANSTVGNFVTKYTIAVSNRDGIYGADMPMHVHNSVCTSVTVTGDMSYSFSMTEQCCYIDRAFHDIEYMNPDNASQICDPGRSKMSWSDKLDINECSPNPCQNGGTCTNDINSYWCACGPGFNGTNCENICPNGYYGMGCRELCNCHADHTDECREKDGKCVCVDGWYGPQCDTDIKECANVVCPMHSECVNELGTHQCICNDGFRTHDDNCKECEEGQYGKNCEGVCACNVQHTHNCSKEEGACTCHTGWTGDTCGNDIDECIQNPCPKLAGCTNTDGSYTCQCPMGYKMHSAKCEELKTFHLELTLDISVVRWSGTDDPVYVSSVEKSELMLQSHYKSDLGRTFVDVEVKKIRTGSLIIDHFVHTWDVPGVSISFSTSVASLLKGKKLIYDKSEVYANSATIFTQSDKVTMTEDDHNPCVIVAAMEGCPENSHCEIDNKGVPFCAEELTEDVERVSDGSVILAAISGSICLALVVISGCIVCRRCQVPKPPKYTPNSIAVEWFLSEDHCDTDLRFRCKIEPTDVNDITYKIHWYINQDAWKQSEFFNHTTVSNVFLHQDDLPHLDITISCGVEARITEGGMPTDIFKSEDFFIGIKVHTPVLYIDRSSSEPVKAIMQATVPIQCIVLPKTCLPIPDVPCIMTVRQLEYDTDACPNWDVTFNHVCRTSAMGDNWNANFSLDVQVSAPAVANAEETSRVLQLEVAPDFTVNTLWHKYQLPGIRANDYIVTESIALNPRGGVSPRGTSASITSLLTCQLIPQNDGVNLYENQLLGYFVMYRHTVLLQEVQILTHACMKNDRSPYCVCGVAVRAGKDVFVYSVCAARPHVSLHSCDNGIIDIRQDTRDGSYKIFLPTGTMVGIQTIYWITRQLNVVINPSPKDVDKSVGLCGVLSSSAKSDFCFRDTTKPCLTHPGDSGWQPDAFLEDWRVLPAEDLFDPTSSAFGKLESWKEEIYLCFCPFNTKETTNPPPNDPEKYGVTDCSSRMYNKCQLEMLHATNSRKFQCPIKSYSSRRRREAYQKELHRRYRRSLGTLSQLNNEVPNEATSGNWTEATSEEYCRNYLDANIAYSMCKENVDIDIDGAIVNCGQDIMLTGTTGWSLAALEAAVGSCRNAVEMNNTITNSSDSTNASTVGEVIFPDENPILDTILSYCPYNCSSNGACINGTCVCYDGFGAGDCSINLKQPPDVYDIYNESLCDMLEADCTDISLYGEEFIDSQNLTCHLTCQQVYPNGDVIPQTPYDVKGGYISAFEVKCKVHSGEGTGDVFVTECNISVSNTADLFSQEMAISIYDSNCTTHSLDNGQNSFDISDQCCYIDYKFYNLGDTHVNKESMICDTDRSKTDWSEKIGVFYLMYFAEPGASTTKQEHTTVSSITESTTPEPTTTTTAQEQTITTQKPTTTTQEPTTTTTQEPTTTTQEPTTTTQEPTTTTQEPTTTHNTETNNQHRNQQQQHRNQQPQHTNRQQQHRNRQPQHRTNNNNTETNNHDTGTNNNHNTGTNNNNTGTNNNTNNNNNTGTNNNNTGTNNNNTGTNNNNTGTNNQTQEQQPQHQQPQHRKRQPQHRKRQPQHRKRQPNGSHRLSPQPKNLPHSS